MKLLFKHIKELVQVRDTPVRFISGDDMKVLPTIKNAYLLVEDGIISSYGSMSNCPSEDGCDIVDATGRLILPTWCDSHTHLVYAGNREQEFVQRIQGKSYEEIANLGGGILNSAKLLQQTSAEDLYEQSKHRLQEVISMGTGAIEIKSGYGLTLEAELKMLRVIKQLASEFSLPIRSTFLGAHAFPSEYKNNKQGYIDLLINELLLAIAKENLADYVDVFCEEGYFSVADTEQIVTAAKKHGLPAKLHVNQFNSIGGVELGVRCGALSVDHLEVMTDKDFNVLADSDTMPVALPACSYFLGIPYTPARKMIDDSLALALASDYNPGSCPSGNMNFVVATACIKMGMLPEEAINAATINGAYAMGLDGKVGAISKGYQANIMMTKDIPSVSYIPYSFGSKLIDKVYLNGNEVN